MFNRFNQHKCLRFATRARLHAGVIAIALSLLPEMAATESVRRDHIAVELVSDRTSIAPGDTFIVALRMIPDHEWHVYWKNPGDAGLAPRVRWQLPEGFTVGELEFPIPKKIPAGPLVSFGYEGEVLYPSRVIAPPNLVGGSTISLLADVDWLVCKVECIPGDAMLHLDLAVSNDRAVDSEWESRLAGWHNSQPAASSDWDITASASASRVTLIGRRANLQAQLPSSLTFFPEQKGVLENAATQSFELTDDGFRLSVTRNRLFLDSLTHLSGLLVADSAWLDGERRALAVSTPVQPLAASRAVEPELSWWQAVLFAFVGGIILNLMPCVLPVLSIKIMGVVGKTASTRRETFRHNLFYLCGVLISFWSLASVLLFLKASGRQLGWGFQLQSPEFIVVLATFMFLLGLNLMGVFEVGASLTGIGGRSRSGDIGSFISGVTATVVATPCTAPFMGAALGFSLTQPALISLSIFTALGLGMAAPYILVTSSPRFLRFMPKPGRWMESLKQFMGFLIFGTVVWLVWVLGAQAGTNAVGLLLLGLLVVAAGAWVLGRWGSLMADARQRMIARVMATLLIVGAVGSVIVNLPMASTTIHIIDNVSGVKWEPFSPQRVAELRQVGRPVLIDFTAAWCLSCQVNERVAFGSADVQSRLRELGVATLKADWTSRDDVITRALAEFGRNSVPLYVLYRGDAHSPPRLLPEILTPAIVLSALNEIES